MRVSGGGSIGEPIQKTEKTVTVGDRVEINCDATGGISFNSAAHSTLDADHSCLCKELGEVDQSVQSTEVNLML